MYMYTHLLSVALAAKTLYWLQSIQMYY